MTIPPSAPTGCPSPAVASPGHGIGGISWTMREMTEEKMIVLRMQERSRSVARIPFSSQAV